MFAPAHPFTSGWIRIPRHLQSSRSRPCYHGKLMTLSFPSSRVLPIFGLSVALLLQSASLPVAGPGSPDGADANPMLHFTHVAQKAGLAAPVIFGGENTKKYIIETTGTGVAIFDYDNDGWPDIFVVNGTKLGSLPSGKAPTSHLYHNNHDGTFTDVTEKAGLMRTGWGQGVCVGDYDNDGNLDLFVTYYGRNVLYHNNGDGTFNDVTRESGLLQTEDHWNTGAAFVDYNRDGHLDLFVSNYVDHQYGFLLYDSNPALMGEQSPVV